MQFTNSKDVRCAEFISTFMKPDGRRLNENEYHLDEGGVSLNKNSPARYKDSRLQSLWNENPNKLNKAFIGLGESVNGVKGCIFNKNCKGLKKVKKGPSDEAINANLNLWNDM